MIKAEEAKYMKSHEYVHIAQSVVGVSDFAQHEMGDVVYVELPKIGQKIEAGKQCAVIESVKSAFDIYSPVSGEVTEVNAAVQSDPALVNQSPYGEGWLFKLKITGEADGLMDWEAYQKFTKEAH